MMLIGLNIVLKSRCESEYRKTILVRSQNSLNTISIVNCKVKLKLNKSSKSLVLRPADSFTTTSWRSVYDTYSLY